MKMIKQMVLASICAFLCCSCGIKIASTEKRISCYIDEKNAKDFKSKIKHGEIIAEDTIGSHRLIVVRENPSGVAGGKQLHLYDEQFKFRKFLLPGYKRKIYVTTLADFSPDDIEFSSTNAAGIFSASAQLTEKSCNVINSIKGIAGLNFNLFRVAGKDESTAPGQYFTGIYTEFIPCKESKLFTILSNPLHLPSNFTGASGKINCLPYNCKACKFLAGIKNGEPVWWNSDDTKPPETKDDQESKDTGDSLVIPFNYTCGTAFNFAVNLVNDKRTGDGTIYILNRLEKPVSSGSDTRNPVTVQKLKKDSPAIKEPPFKNFNAYHYNSNFDIVQFNYLNELKRLYPALEESCARELIFLISNALFRHDSALIKFRYLPDEKPKTEEKKKVSPGPIKQGSVVILPQAPVIMEPEYSSSGQKNNIVINLKLQLNGDYDSTANQLTFMLRDTTLSNKFGIYDASRIITKTDWNNAVNMNGGIYNLGLLVKTVSLKDSLQSTQTGYVVIKGDTANPNSYQEIQLKSYNPNKPFWVEFGSNFDLLDKLEANNLYGGIFMYKKDVAKFNRFKKPNISIIGGVYESKAVSSEQAKNFANFEYLDNSTFSSSPTITVHQDTGTVTKAASVNNLGVFISPQVRLTNGSAEADGLHVFAALWIELVWQRATVEFDYSKTAKLTTFTAPAAQFGNYSYKPATLKGDFRSHYFGLGLPIFLKEGYYNLYLNSVIGYSNQPGLYENFSDNDKGFKDFTRVVRATDDGKIPWLPFYLFQFRLNEERFGISFTGEIRSAIGAHYKPYVTLALSKKFDLTKLLNF